MYNDSYLIFFETKRLYNDTYLVFITFYLIFFRDKMSRVRAMQWDGMRCIKDNATWCIMIKSNSVQCTHDRFPSLGITHSYQAEPSFSGLIFRNVCNFGRDSWATQVKLAASILLRLCTPITHDRARQIVAVRTLVDLRAHACSSYFNALTYMPRFDVICVL